MTVVSDTSPLRYLIFSGHVHLIQDIFGHVMIPSAVDRELRDAAAPSVVREWISRPPVWLEVVSSTAPGADLSKLLDQGEAEAIQLAMDVGAEFLLIDEHRGRSVAASRGATVIGVLGILLEAYRRRLITNPLEVLADLVGARFRLSPRLIVEFEEQVRRLS